MFGPGPKDDAPEAQDEPMLKEGRSAAYQEILDLLTELEMEPHRPKPPAEPPAGPITPGAGPPEGEAPPDVIGMEPEGGGGALSEEEIAELQAKLASMGG